MSATPPAAAVFRHKSQPSCAWRRIDPSRHELIPDLGCDVRTRTAGESRHLPTLRSVRSGSYPRWSPPPAVAATQIQNDHHARRRTTGQRLATFAEYERRLGGQRTRDALAQKRREGVLLGRPNAMDPKVRERIERERKTGRSYAAIADALTNEGVSTAHGGRRWHASTLRAALMTQDLFKERP